MSYIDGYVIPVPIANKQAFIDFAIQVDPLFKEYGATRVMECWGDAIPDGKETDFKKAVNAKDDETVLFSWVEWPSKKFRDEAMEKAMKDPRFSPDGVSVPFDGARMIMGGFTPVVEL